MRRVLPVVTGAVLWLLAGHAAIDARQAASGLPASLEDYLTAVVRLTPAERRQMLDGRAIARLIEADPTQEVSVFGAVWIAGPMADYLELAHDVERLERGPGFRVTRRISSPPRLEDFDDMTLPVDDVKDLRSCRIGDCEVKLDEGMLARLRAGVDWTASDAREQVDRVMRRAAFDYVNAYLEGGNARLAVYRDRSRARSVAVEFREMVEGMPWPTTDMPSLEAYLLDFPRVALPAATSFLYWQETEFGLKPTLRISHVTILPTGDGAVMASKMLYASHYFRAGIELRLLVRDSARGPGFWFVTVSRSRSDGLTGFTGHFVRRRAQSRAVTGALAWLETTKRRIEGR